MCGKKPSAPPPAPKPVADPTIANRGEPSVVDGPKRIANTGGDGVSGGLSGGDGITKSVLGG